MREYLNSHRYRWRCTRGEVVTVALIAGGIALAGYIGAKMYGNSKKNEGKQETQIEQYKALKKRDEDITVRKNQYLKVQMPKRRRYEEAVEGKDNAKERAEATLDMFDRSKH